MTTVVTAGAAVQDFVLTVDRLPQGDGKTFAHSARVVGGGPAATAAATVVALGGTARFVGRVGDDEPGRWIREDLERWGVDVTLLATVPGARSAVSSVVVASNGDRMIVNHTDDALFAAPPPPVTDGVDAVLADLRWPQGALGVLREAREQSVPGVLDFDTNTAGEQGAETLRHASHVVFSMPALRALTGVDDAQDALVTASGLTTAVLAVTRGSAGTIWLDGRLVRTVPAHEVDVVDTLGAGDVFHGAFALRLAEGGSVAESLEFASVAAALKCTRPGGREGLPSRTEVDQHMEDDS